LFFSPFFRLDTDQWNVDESVKFPAWFELELREFFYRFAVRSIRVFIAIESFNVFLLSIIITIHGIGENTTILTLFNSYLLVPSQK